MFKILLHKNLRDFKSNFSEFFSIFILSLISILVFAGLYSASNGMEHEFNSWAQSSKMADEWVTVKGANSNDIHKLLKKKSVKDVQKQYVFNSYTGSTESKKMLQTVVINNNKISKPDIGSGKKISFQTEGVWLDQKFARSNKYHVGDYIDLDSGNGEKSFEIKGLIVSPNYIGYTGPNNNIIADHKRYGYVITNTRTMSVPKNQFNQVLVTKNKGYSGKRLEKDTRNALSTKVISLVDRNTFNNVSKFINKYNSITKMAVMFSLILFLLVLLVTQTTISRLVNNQRNIIGLFRALGLKKRSIIAHYSIYGVITTFLGGLAGAFLGMEFISKLILSKQEPLFGVPVWQARISNLTWIILGVLVLISLMASIWKIMQILKNKTAEILQKETVTNSSKNIFEYFPNFWNNLRWNWKWVLRDKSRAKSKELIGVIGIVGSLMLLIASIGIEQSLNKTNHDTYTNVFQYQTELKISPLKHQESFKNLKNKLGADDQEIEQTSLNIRTSQGEAVTSGNIISKGIYLKLPLESNRTVNLQAKNGVYVTNFAAKKLNIKTGDNVEINSAAMVNKKIVPILGIIKISSPQGIYLSKNYWEDLKQPFVPTSLYTTHNINKSIKHNKSVDQVKTIDENLNDTNKLLDSFKSIIVLLIVFSLFLSWFVLYNLGMLNFTERYREYATMRVLGFRLNEIRSVIIKDNLLTWLEGTIIGIPLGLAFLKAYVSIANSDTSEFFSYISIGGLVIAGGILFVNVVLIAWLISHHIKKVDMASALKSVD